ncbi:MAG: DsbE family thiol:disulfide interchange protein [Xanthomonadales bacterium]|nr:DsbE family thiol:disulfide interchange protein [Xanthomonadales bacterium]
MIARLFIPLGLFLGLAVLLWSGLGKDPTILPSTFLDKPVPAFEATKLREPGVPIASQSLAGEPYLLNVFASWCLSCRVEHPVLDAYAKRGALKLVGLNYRDQREDALAWLNRFGDPYAEIIWDPDGRLGIDFGITGAPESFVVDAQGIIRYKVVGAISPEIMEQEILPRLRGSKN